MKLLTDAWLATAVRERVRDRIVANEQKTGAELVVTVAGCAGDYRHADGWFGALCSLFGLLFYYFHPAPLPDDLSLAIVVLCYPTGMLAAAAFAPLRRLLLRERLLRDNVEREARARFVAQGIATTRGRTGVLVFVSRFERHACVVADIGIPVATLGASWQAATSALATAARSGSVAAFLAALDGLGDLLATAVPRSADDVNELPDEVGR
jgi:putative membrane protein